MNPNRRRFLGTAAAVSFAPCVFAAAKTAGVAGQADGIQVPDAAFTATLPKLMEISQVPGLGVGVVQDGRLVWQYYAGVAHTQSRVPITADSLFNAASLGKPVFAYAALRYAQAGKLDLDRPLKSYLSEDMPSGEFAERATARHVLSHSTGFVNWRDSPDEALTSSFEPGATFQYSGEGYFALQRCIEGLSGQGCEAWMQQTMKSLGMRSSTYLWREDAPQRIVDGHYDGKPKHSWDFRRELFARIETGGEPLAAWNSARIAKAMRKADEPKLVPNRVVPNVAGSLLTTVPDYAAFLAHLLSSSAQDGSGLEEPLRDAMWRPRTRIDDALSWGLGWGAQRDAAACRFWAWGDNGAWKNFVLGDPATRSAVVVFTNGSNGMRLAERIVRATSGRDNAAFLWVAA
ncbi:MAG: beta-lactamase family protein [Rudaea sp.]|uniref:serine hydrolase domain-containing protein n=1 Tax=unclassified Rudaea TaxID=2627037 RepID=UPI0010F67EEF|nr:MULTISPECIES: serine hydrolase domain-containing protein [unclassified Rudaea]MBN8884291.1 beta-lactamase family protein [Rudaea sp.]MBR0345296.1 beta-lactamase family protein [Rudaea sp.]